MSDMFCYFARIILWSQSLLLGIHIFYHLLLSSAYKNIIKFSCMCVCVCYTCLDFCVHVSACLILEEEGKLKLKESILNLYKAIPNLRDEKCSQSFSHTFPVILLNTFRNYIQMKNKHWNISSFSSVN